MASQECVANHAKQNQKKKIRYLARIWCRFHLCHGVLEHFGLLENLPWTTPNVSPKNIDNYSR
jgi:hypothetical protein